MKIKYLLLLLLLIPYQALADTHNSPSCSWADVNTTITNATAGDTITVPVGECTWTSPISITKSIYLIGAGTANTIITHGYAGELITVSLSSNVDVRISGFYIRQTTNNPGQTAIKIIGKKDGSFAYTKVRIDNNKLEKGSRTIHATGWIEGLIDNNTFVNCNIGIGVTGDNNQSWGRTIAAGTANSLFIEDNTFTITNDTDREPNQQVYIQEGGRSVTRYNTFDGSAYTNGNTIPFDSHGNQDRFAEGIYFRGQPIIEVYKNTFIAHHSYATMDIRSGSSLIWGNSFTFLSGSIGHVIRLWEEEAWSTSHFPDYLDTAWPAEDQINNTFIWDNTVNGSALTSVSFNDTVKAPTFIQENRDYFLHAPQASGGKETYTGRQGAAGNGADGTLTFSSEGANAYYPYTAYTYPHPLREGTDTTPPTLVSATIDSAGTSLYLVFSKNVTVNTNTGFVLTADGSPSLTYASGTGTTTLIYTISVARFQSETGMTLAYTTGANYIEDAAGNDLGSFTGTAVTNNSTQVETPPALTLSISNHTGAVVTSSPSGLNCGSTCSADFENGTVVTVSGFCLQNYSTFTIGGDCSAETGQVTVNGAKSCTATCTKTAPTATIGAGAAVTLGTGAVGTLY